MNQDLRYAFRTLAKSPVFTTVAVLSLALGIGVNTAIFSLVDRLLLRSLPVRDPQLLTLLDSPGPMAGRVEGAQAFTYPAYKELAARNDVFTGILARYGTSVSLTWKGGTDLVAGELVSGNYFDLLGVRPHLGRLIAPSDDVTPGGHPVAVLGYGLWMRKFGGDRDIVGQKIVLNGSPFEVIGVSAPRFEGVVVGNSVDVFVPVSMKRQATPTHDGLDQRNYWFLNLFARLKPGITPEQAQARLAPVYRTILEADLVVINIPVEQFRTRYLKKALLVKPGYFGRSDLREQLSAPSLVLMSMVGLVLLIACANLANLLLARAAARQREIAIRLSLGASRGDLIRQLFTESAVLALAGGGLGVLVAVWAGDLLMGFVPGANSVGGNLQDWSTPDGRVLAFNFAVSLATAFLFGLVPAWKATRPQVSSTLKDQAGSVSSSLGDVRLRKGLVVAQIALSTLLLAGAALFGKSLHNLRSLDPGFAPEGLLTFVMDPSLSGYQGQKAIDVLDRVRAGFKSIPGVRAVAATNNGVLAGNIAIATVNIEGVERREGLDMNPDIAWISPGFFSAMGVRLLAGREFTDADRPGTQPVAIVNDAFVKRYFPKENPLGRRLGIGRAKPEIVIVGVVAAMRQRDMRDANRPMYYIPAMHDERPGGYAFYVRGAGSGTELAAAVRREARRIAPAVPLFEMRSMEAQVDAILSIERAVSTMSAFFGLLATLLAAVGLYGVMAYTVTRRTREIGIRVALGAERSNVLWLVLREVTLMAVAGVAIGLPLALGLSRYVEAQLFGVKPVDPLMYALAAGVMMATAALAGFLPANRATRVDPIQALRYE